MPTINCHVKELETPTEIITDAGNAFVTIHERSSRAYGMGLATVHSCALLAAILSAQELGVELGSEFKTSEFCQECSSLVKMTLTPTRYKFL